ncbi:MAG: F0F1 ATP synthase subunit delta [Selenomonadaceae bacterium]|jgi:F-type H+-transporting ATPase subunit delta|nr:F0F1 ATP synthase subunit delta [Selenomonadaceae bacterium]MBP3723608.1 F0F1 ATP synthase subunit delta [Selenomonadaceae bacterium]
MLNLEVARKYAGAMFELANEENKLEAYGKDLKKVSDEFFSIDGVKEFFANPQVEQKAKKELITKVCAGEVDTKVYHFLMLLIDKRRIQMFREIEAMYQTLSNDARGIYTADVWSVKGLSKNDENALKNKLEKVTGKKISLRLHEDKSLIGGLIVKIGDRRVDGSIAGRLNTLSRELSA